MWACVCAYVLCECMSVHVYMIAACMFFVVIGSAGHVNRCELRVACFPFGAVKF